MLLILINFVILQALAGDQKVDLAKPLATLFSHKTHQQALKKNEMDCMRCHSFAHKAEADDPLAKGVASGHLKPDRAVCHQCHMGKVATPRPNQCTLCHTNIDKLMPPTHKKNWKFRHGTSAQTDSDTCKECHDDRSCTKCHTQRDNIKPSVHRPNFRISHSIEARANPQSCTVCHSNTSYCIQCHTRGIK